ncbi:hypothetical protein FB446DRAFT_709832 [Lentinula raphanica]|nr:hypothetical protein FB446DRAFT_709832 [Lentinula raphanica]
MVICECFGEGFAFKYFTGGGLLITEKSLRKSCEGNHKLANQRGPPVDQPNLTTSKGSSQKPTLIWILSDEEDDREGISEDDTSNDGRIFEHKTSGYVSKEYTSGDSYSTLGSQSVGLEALRLTCRVLNYFDPDSKIWPKNWERCILCPHSVSGSSYTWQARKVQCGFFTLEQAKEAYHAAHSNSGVISAICVGAGRPIWSVIEGLQPAIYESIHDALCEGLEWGTGHLKGFSNEADAKEDWAAKANTNPSRIIATASPRRPLLEVHASNNEHAAKDVYSVHILCLYMSTQMSLRNEDYLR